MIAKNLMKYAEAMAVQMVLRFGPLRTLRLARPTTRAGREARAARSAIRKAFLSVRVMYPAKRKTAPRQRRNDNRAAQFPLFSVAGY